MTRFFLAIIALSLLASCRSSRAIGKAVARKDTIAKPAPSPADVARADTQQLIKSSLAQLSQARLSFTTFSAKVGVDYRGTDGKGHDVNANIKMYKDSAIWVSVNALLGIEALRLLITKDSVKWMNKLEKTYAARDIGFLQEATGLPLDLPTLQDLIIGNPVYLDSNIVRYSRTNGVTTLVSLGKLFRNLLTLNESTSLPIHSKLTDNDPFRARTADLSYSEYESSTGRPFATKRQIIVSERGRLEIKLDFKNLSFTEEVSFPFKVPKNYPRV